MAHTIIRTIQSKNNGTRIPIPRYVREALNWGPGDVLAFTINADDTVTLTKIAVPQLTRSNSELHT